ncbi:hypothetical protein FB451DRAFT_1363191 [Mycena latifolia]|nr:hypothetical protein FB451DRAFT_1363191 [Mycena latifolia]
MHAYCVRCRRIINQGCCNLISAGKLCDDGHDATFGSRDCLIKRPPGKIIATGTRSTAGLYTLNCETAVFTTVSNPAELSSRAGIRDAACQIIANIAYMEERAPSSFVYPPQYVKKTSVNEGSSWVANPIEVGPNCRKSARCTVTLCKRADTAFPGPVGRGSADAASANVGRPGSRHAPPMSAFVRKAALSPKYRLHFALAVSGMTAEHRDSEAGGERPMRSRETVSARPAIYTADNQVSFVIWVAVVIELTPELSFVKSRATIPF